MCPYPDFTGNKEDIWIPIWLSSQSLCLNSILSLGGEEGIMTSQPSPLPQLPPFDFHPIRSPLLPLSDSGSENLWKHLITATRNSRSKLRLHWSVTDGLESVSDAGRIDQPSLGSYSETLKISKAHKDVSGTDSWQAKLARRTQFTEPLIRGGVGVVKGGGFLRKETLWRRADGKAQNSMLKEPGWSRNDVTFFILLLFPAQLSLCLSCRSLLVIRAKQEGRGSQHCSQSIGMRGELTTGGGKEEPCVRDFKMISSTRAYLNLSSCYF